MVERRSRVRRVAPEKQDSTFRKIIMSKTSSRNIRSGMRTPMHRAAVRGGCARGVGRGGRLARPGPDPVHPRVFATLVIVQNTDGPVVLLARVAASPSAIGHDEVPPSSFEEVLWS